MVILVNFYKLKKENKMKAFSIYQMITDKIPCGFTWVEVRSIGYKYVYVRPFYHGNRYGAKPKQFKKIKRSIWDSIASNRHFKEITNRVNKSKR
tara:strand:- start:621 stop:902 length:282 start_codon:yes stop_codon:yes gene_type:complete